MESNDKHRGTTIAVVAGIVGVLLGLCLGAMAGGVGGYLIGRGAAQRATLMPRITPLQPEIPALPERATPTPPAQRLPRLPSGVPEGGALVQELVKGGPAESAGVKVGDIITQVDRNPVDANHRLSDVLATYKPNDRVTLTVWRAGRTQTIAVQLAAHPDDARRAYLGVRYSDMTIQRQEP